MTWDIQLILMIYLLKSCVWLPNDFMKKEFYWAKITKMFPGISERVIESYCLCGSTSFDVPFILLKYRFLTLQNHYWGKTRPILCTIVVSQTLECSRCNYTDSIRYYCLAGTESDRIFGEVSETEKHFLWGTKKNLFLQVSTSLPLATALFLVSKTYMWLIEHYYSVEYGIK